MTEHNKADVKELTEYWHRETNYINDKVDAAFKEAQDHAYALGLAHGRAENIASTPLQQQEQSGEAVSVSTAELTLIERLRGLAAMIESQDGWRPTAIDEAITAIEYQEAVISDFQSSPATPTATASQEADEDAPFTLDDAIAHANGLEHQVKMLTRQRDGLELIARMVAGALEKAGFKADEVDNPADAIELLHTRLMAATASQESAPGQEAVIKYVGTTDEAPKCDKHPNDNEPRCEKLIERFRIMGADVGQGLHPYWKWAYATGFNDAKRVFKVDQTPPTSTAIAAMVIKQAAEALRELARVNVALTPREALAKARDVVLSASPAAAKAELEALRRDAEYCVRFKNALHNISLCSRNTHSSKHDCGAIARDALASYAAINMPANGGGGE